MRQESALWCTVSWRDKKWDELLNNLTISTRERRTLLDIRLELRVWFTAGAADKAAIKVDSSNTLESQHCSRERAAYAILPARAGGKR